MFFLGVLPVDEDEDKQKEEDEEKQNDCYFYS